MRRQMSIPIEFDYARGILSDFNRSTNFRCSSSRRGGGELISLFVAQKALAAYKAPLLSSL